MTWSVEGIPDSWLALLTACSEVLSCVFVILQSLPLEVLHQIHAACIYLGGLLSNFVCLFLGSSAGLAPRLSQ